MRVLLEEEMRVSLSVGREKMLGEYYKYFLKYVGRAYVPC
jgi:hypothetical protein